MKTKATLHSSSLWACTGLICGALFTSSCQKNDVLDDVKVNSKTSELAAAGPGGGVLMQAFYWDCTEGTWWNTVKGKVPAWNTAGFTAIWLPPSQKCQNGGQSMGYDPTDYYDFGDYNQNGSTRTRFGTKTELTSLITTAHSNSLQVYADMVLNHNSGGASESNPYAGGSTWTKFNVSSGKFNRSYSDFHPNNLHSADEGAFGGFPDLCHAQEWVSRNLWAGGSMNGITISTPVSTYYKNTMKYDGYRFDFVKGFGAWVVQNFMGSVSGSFAVGEMWDGSAATCKAWVDGTGRTSSAFDFPLYYGMNDAFNGNDFTKLSGDFLWKRDAAKTVTFVSNHDTDIMGNGKYLAYAYIMTHEGYPCVFYQDYETWLDKTKLNNLIWIHRNLGTGTTTNLWTDNDEYIARRNGSGTNKGLIVYLNNSSTTWQSRTIQTNWASGTKVKDYTGNSGWVLTVDASGKITIEAPPRNSSYSGYSVWSVQ